VFDTFLKTLPNEGEKPGLEPGKLNMIKIAAEPHRMMILVKLTDGEGTITSLSKSLSYSKQTIIKHLGVHERNGLVLKRKVENTEIYSISEAARTIVLEVLEMHSRVGGAKSLEVTAGAERHQLTELSLGKPASRVKSIPLIIGISVALFASARGILEGQPLWILSGTLVGICLYVIVSKLIRHALAS